MNMFPYMHMSVLQPKLSIFSLYLAVGRTLTLNPDMYCKQSVAFSEGIL